MVIPLVSILIPNYNHAPFLKQRIESILDQTFQDFELIILDDASSDNSRYIIEQYRSNSKVKEIIYNKFNSGSPFNQWKEGISLMSGKYCWIAESDDWSDILFLEKLIGVLEVNSEIAFVYSQTFDIKETGEIIQSRINWTSDFYDNIWLNDFCISGDEFLKYLYIKSVVPNVSACLIQREIIYKILQKETNIGKFKMSGDWLIWLLIANIENIKISFVNEHLNYFRHTQQSTRIHSTKSLKLRRLLEEANVFNSGKFKINEKELMEKNFSLKIKWFSVFAHTGYSFSFFKICNTIGCNKYSFFKQYHEVHNFGSNILVMINLIKLHLKRLVTFSNI
jgi:glycosyltransferase involved in cell wall biosynthesis